MADATVTWLGDEDPAVQSITQYGHTFVKGEPTKVKGSLAKFEGNPMFSIGKKGEPVEADEPEPADPEEGTEKAALKAELASRGVSVKGNPSTETLRKKLADLAEKDEGQQEPVQAPEA